MKIYLAGKITGDDNYKEKFRRYARAIPLGARVMNPAVLPTGFEHHEYTRICFAMIDVCDAVLFLPDWEDSKGAKMEHEYARGALKRIGYIVGLNERPAYSFNGHGFGQTISTLEVDWDDQIFRKTL